MANFGVVTPTAIKPNNYTARFVEGYGLGSKIRDRKDKRKKEAALSEYAEALGSSPEPVTEAIPGVSALPSDDFDAPAAIPGGQGAGTDFDAPAAVSGGIPDAAASVARTKSPGKISAKQWDDRRKRLHELAAKTGDPTIVASVDENLDKQLQQGFMRYGARARILIANGQMEAAVTELQKAYNYFPNGSNVKFQITKKKDGSPIILAEGYDEETGDARGSSPLEVEDLDRMMAFMQDPAMAARYYKQDNYKKSAESRAETGVALAKKADVRAEQGATRAEASFVVDQKLKKLSVDLKEQNLDKAEFETRMRDAYGEQKVKYDAERSKYAADSQMYKAITERENAEWNMSYGKPAKTAKLDKLKLENAKAKSAAISAAVKAEEDATGVALSADSRLKKTKQVEAQYKRVTDVITKMFDTGAIPYDTGSDAMVQWSRAAYKLLSDPRIKKAGLSADEVVMKAFGTLRAQGVFGDAPVQTPAPAAPGQTGAIPPYPPTGG